MFINACSFHENVKLTINGIHEWWEVTKTKSYILTIDRRDIGNPCTYYWSVRFSSKSN